MNKTKSFEISKILIYQTYKEIKANKGAAGVDDVTLEQFDNNLQKNLYKI